ncbi:MAG: hypothetical protein LQ337_003056 [Flavoplaca oasis]|nr:MAG: hypothetical protein LQ337_003056 [Flavoplaca oasis]
MTAKQQKLEKRYQDSKSHYAETLRNLAEEATARHEAQKRVTKLENSVTKLENLVVSDYHKSVMLIDADNYKFQKVFLSDVANGGRLAAEKLMAETSQHIQKHLNEPNLYPMVYAYANLEGLSKACLRENRTKGKDLRQFVGQFNARYTLFNFIDVGYGDQRADSKIQNARTGEVLP